MASIVRRSVRAFCETCEEPVVFEVRPNWTFVCTECGQERRLARNGLLKSA